MDNDTGGIDVSNHRIIQTISQNQNVDKSNVDNTLVIHIPISHLCAETVNKSISVSTSN